MIVSRELLARICAELQQQGGTVVFTNGCFDILHAGHTTYLNRAKSLGEVLVVGVNSDDSVRRLKGPSRPVNTQDDRAVVLSALRSVDYVCVFHEDTPLELITAIQPDVLVKGGDYSIDTIVGADVVLGRGGKVLSLPFVEGKSTTSVIERMKEQ